MNATDIRETILRLATERGEAKTVCPSEVARAIAGQDEKRWRLQMKPIRAVAVRMAQAGEIELRRKGSPIDPQDFKGIYRIALPAGAAGPGRNSGMRPDSR